MTDWLEIFGVKWSFSFTLQHVSNDFNITQEIKKRQAEADIWSTSQRAITFFSFSSYMCFLIMAVSHDLGNFLPS